MQPKQTHKLYCYVDETGQDTTGKFFIVAIVVADKRRDDLQQWLEAIERDSGKRTKWMKTSDKSRCAYIEALIDGEPPAQIYAKTYHMMNWKYSLLLKLLTCTGKKTSSVITIR